MFFWIVVGALAVVEGLIILTSLRIRLVPHALKGPLGARPMELLWTLVPALILVAMVLLSFQALQDDDEPTGDRHGVSAAFVAQEWAALTAPGAISPTYQVEGSSP